jgi:hypothetical protein
MDFVAILFSRRERGEQICAYVSRPQPIYGSTNDALPTSINALSTSLTNRISSGPTVVDSFGRLVSAMRRAAPQMRTAVVRTSRQQTSSRPSGHRPASTVCFTTHLATLVVST